MAKKSRKTVSMVVTQGCNLRCVYCYEANKTNQTMPVETALGIVQKVLGSTDAGYDECVLEFFGGEPFLNFNLIRQVCDSTWGQPWNKPYLFFATTNGTLVHGEIQAWLQNNARMFTIGLSLDGPAGVHNLNRSNSFTSIDVPFFLENWPDQPVKMTVSKESLPRLAESVLYLHDLGFKVENNLAFGIDWAEAGLLTVLERELGKLVEYYLAHPLVKPCRLLDMKIEYIGGNSLHKWCGVGTHMVTYDVDGLDYPCHTFLPLSIGQEKARLSRGIVFAEAETVTDPMCEACVLLPICPTCYGFNYSKRGDIHKRDQSLCRVMKLRALACSYLVGRKILNGEDDQYTEKMKEQAIQAVLAIQNSCTIE